MSSKGNFFQSAGVNRSLIFVKKNTLSLGSLPIVEQVVCSSTGLRVGLFSNGSVESLAKETRDRLDSTHLRVYEEDFSHENETSSYQSRMNAQRSRIEQPVISIKRAPQIITSLGAPFAKAPAEAQSQSAKVLPRRLAEHSAGKSQRKTQQQPKQATLVFNPQDCLVLMEPDAKQDQGGSDMLTSLQQMSNLWQQSNVQSREELNLQKVRPLNYRPKIQRLIKEALESHAKQIVSGKRISNSAKKREALHSYSNRGTGSVIYPSDRDAMLIGNYTSDPEGFDDSAQSFFSKQNTSPSLNKNFVFTGKRIHQMNSGIANFQSLAYAANPPVAAQNARKQNLLKKSIRNLSNASDRPQPLQSRKKDRKHIVSVAGKKIELQSSSSQRSTQNSTHRCVLQTANGSQRQREDARLVRQPQLEPVRPTTQEYATQRADRTPNYPVKQQPDQSGQSLQTTTVLPNAEAWLQYGLGQAPPDSYRESLKTLRFKKESVEDSPVFASELQPTDCDMNTLRSRESQVPQGGQLRASTPGLQLTLMQLRDATQISTSNHSGSLEHSQKLAPRISVDGVDDQPVQAQNQQSLALHCCNQLPQSPHALQKPNQNKSVIQSSQRSVGSRSVYKTSIAFYKEKADPFLEGRLRVTSQQQLNRPLSEDPPEQHRSRKDRTVDSGGASVDEIARRFAEELMIESRGVQLQAEWLAQASMSIGMVKKTLSADKAAEVAPATRKAFVKYLQRLLEQAEVEISR